MLLYISNNAGMNHPKDIHFFQEAPRPPPLLLALYRLRVGNAGRDCGMTIGTSPWGRSADNPEKAPFRRRFLIGIGGRILRPQACSSHHGMTNLEMYFSSSSRCADVLYGL